MNMEPLVSIIMPTHNNGPFIGEAIQSILDQTYSNWELLIINDACTDETDVVVGRFSQDSRIRYIKSEASLGRPSIGRNIGLRAARGELITFLDADDKYKPDCLETLAAPLLEDPDLTAAMAFPYYCDAVLNPMYPSRHLIKQPDGALTFHPDYQLSWENICAWKISFFFCCTMFRRDTMDRIGPLDEIYLNGEDFIYHVKLLKLGFDRVRLIPATTYYYRSCPGSITKNPQRLLASIDTHMRITDWLFSQPEIPAALQSLKGPHLSARLCAIVRTLTTMDCKAEALSVLMVALAYPNIPFAVWLKSFWKQLVRVAMPLSMIRLYARYGGRDFHLHTLYNKTGSSKLPGSATKVISLPAAVSPPSAEVSSVS